MQPKADYWPSRSHYPQVRKVRRGWHKSRDKVWTELIATRWGLGVALVLNVVFAALLGECLS